MGQPLKPCLAKNVSKRGVTTTTAALAVIVLILGIGIGFVISQAFPPPPSEGVKTDFISDLYDTLDNIPVKDNLTDEAGLLLVNHANILRMRNPQVPLSQLKAALIIVYGVTLIEAEEQDIIVDPMFVIGTYEEKIVPIIVEVKGVEPPRDESMDCVPPHPPGGFHQIDVEALNDPLVIEVIVDMWPLLEVALT